MIIWVSPSCIFNNKNLGLLPHSRVHSLSTYVDPRYSPRLNVPAFPPPIIPPSQFIDLSNPSVSLKLCGDPRPYPPFVSVSNNVVINFRSDHSIIGNGFSFYPNFNNCPVFAFIPEPFGRVRFASSCKDYPHKVLPSKPLQSQIFLF